MWLKQCSLQRQEMLDDRAERERREKVQRADQQHRAEQQHHERAAGNRECARAGGTSFFCASEPASAMIGMIIRKRPKSMAMPSVVLYQGVLVVRPGEGAAVVAGAGAEGVKHFAQSVRAGVVQPGHAPLADRRPRRRSRGWRCTESAARAWPFSHRRIGFSCRDIPACGRP